MPKENKELCFDLDGTFVDLYGVYGWLDDLIHQNPRPYRIAKPLIDMESFAENLNRLQKNGYKLKIITWTAKNSTDAFNSIIEVEKKNWLKKNLSSVTFDEIYVLPYGTPKQNYGMGYLFDDEKPNRDSWNGIAFDEKNILPILRNLK